MKMVWEENNEKGPQSNDPCRRAENGAPEAKTGPNLEMHLAQHVEDAVIEA